MEIIFELGENAPTTLAATAQKIKKQPDRVFRVVVLRILWCLLLMHSINRSAISNIHLRNNCDKQRHHYLRFCEKVSFDLLIGGCKYVFT